MGVGMATQTIVKFIVGFTTMTIAAGWDVVAIFRRVSFVTIHAGDFCFMSATLGLDVHWLNLMAFDTITIGELVIGCHYRGR